MDLYFACFCIGFFGLLAMAVLGAGHHGGHLHHGHGGAHGHAGGARGGPTPVRSANAARHAGRDANRSDNVAISPPLATGRSAPPGPMPSDGGALANVLAWVSPRVLLSLCLGFGATGLLLHGRGPATAIFGLAALGAFVFEVAAVSPMWNFLLRFASEPARNLETAVLEEAVAVTNFDSSGSGLIAIELDGRHIQVLGNLTADAKQNGQKVRAGDRLFIQAVDSKRNSCTVSAIQNGAVV